MDLHNHADLNILYGVGFRWDYEERDPEMMDLVLLSESGLDLLQQCVKRAGLVDEIAFAQFLRLFDHSVKFELLAGHEDDRRIFRVLVLAQQDTHGIAVHIRHNDIQDQQVRFELLDPAVYVFALGKRKDFETVGDELLFQDRKHIGLVIRDQDLFHGISAASSPICAALL